MAKAALESINGSNLFGDIGSNWSVVFIDIDAHYRNRTNFDTLLPRESASKVIFSPECLFCMRYSGLTQLPICGFLLANFLVSLPPFSLMKYRWWDSTQEIICVGVLCLRLVCGIFSV